MAIGKKTGGKDFKAGHPGGPGRPLLPEEVKTARKYTRHEIELLMAKFGDMSREELVEIAKNPKSRVLDAMIASICAHGISKGDAMRLNFILDRCIGKVTEKVELSGKNGGPIQTESALSVYSTSELIALYEKQKGEVNVKE